MINYLMLLGFFFCHHFDKLHVNKIGTAIYNVYTIYNCISLVYSFIKQYYHIYKLTPTCLYITSIILFTFFTLAQDFLYLLK